MGIRSRLREADAGSWGDVGHAEPGARRNPDSLRKFLIDLSKLVKELP
jgi:hypothetical protein